MVCFETYNVQLQEMRGRLIEDAKRAWSELRPMERDFYSGDLDDETRKGMIPMMRSLKHDITRLEGTINHVQDAIYELTGHVIDYPRFNAYEY